jgi:hypothetical protein
MDLSIIIINYNSADYVIECVKTICGETTGPTYEVIVVDNASYDTCGRLLAQSYPSVKFIQSNTNLGFAKANNLGYRHSTGNVLLFLNPDTKILHNAVSVAYSCVMNDNNVGLVGAKLLNPDMTIQQNSVQAFPTITNQLLDSDLLRRLFPESKLWGVKVLSLEDGKHRNVDVVSGAFMMMKREVFQKAGLFSPDYFMYSEDVDLCYKVWKAGYKVFYHDGVHVLHYGGGSTQKSRINFFSSVQMKQSRYSYFTKVNGKKYAESYRIGILLSSIIRLAFLSLLMLNFPASSRHTMLSYHKWKKICKWAVSVPLKTC